MLTSGGIFAVGGLILGLSSSFPTVQLLGYSVMRGGICAVAVTVFILPALLAIFDKTIRLLTVKNKSSHTPSKRIS
jgi:predicted RND superfamily exporter protein